MGVVALRSFIEPDGCGFSKPGPVWSKNHQTRSISSEGREMSSRLPSNLPAEVQRLTLRPADSRGSLPGAGLAWRPPRHPCRRKQLPSTPRRRCRHGRPRRHICRPAGAPARDVAGVDAGNRGVFTGVVPGIARPLSPGCECQETFEHAAIRIDGPSRSVASLRKPRKIGAGRSARVSSMDSRGLAGPWKSNRGSDLTSRPLGRLGLFFPIST